MWFKELFIIVVIATARASSTAVFVPANKNSTYSVENFNDTKTANDLTNLLNDILESFIGDNVQDGEIVEKTPNDLQRLVKLRTNADLLEFRRSLAFLFKKCIAANWQTKRALQIIAAAANDVTVYEILYETLWQEIRSNRNQTNPFLYLEIYEDLENVLANITSEKLQKLHDNIQIDLVERSAAILQSFFIQKTTVGRLLLRLKNFQNLYQRTVPRVFEYLNNIEDQWQIAKGLLEFDSNTEEAVFNHISLLKYLKSRHEIIPHELYSNLELLLARQNFVNVSENERHIAAQLLPLSMARLFATNKICIRNATTKLYLYECPQTYLMCTNSIANNINPVNRKKAVFEFARIGNGQYTLHSRYWSRYLHLQSNTSDLKNVSSVGMNNTTVSKITKNLYSSLESSAWLVRFRGDFATIQDSTGEFYVCGGNPLYWDKREKHAYTRQSIDSNEIQGECLWLLEDCSDVTA